MQGFSGGVVADEPRAALIGRDVLSAGGTAADAAVATYLTLAVTMPSVGSLGGGGMCLVYDAESEEAVALDFLPRAPGSIDRAADRPAAVPGALRGLFALHARYGTLRWAQVVSAAENLARFGSSVSRALDRELQIARSALGADPEMTRIFSRDDGALVKEGDNLKQFDLAAVLGTARGRGAGALYEGPLAKRFVDAAAEIGAGLTIQDMRGYRPVWYDPVAVEFGDHIMLFAPPPAPFGLTQAQLWQMLTEGQALDDAEPDEVYHRFVEAHKRALAARAARRRAAENSIAIEDIVSEDEAESMMRDYSATSSSSIGSVLGPERIDLLGGGGFVAVDRFGGAVACGVTMNYPFGTGRVAAGTGIVLAAAPGIGGRAPISVAPVMLVNQANRNVIFAGSAAGGAAAAASVVSVALNTLLLEQSLERAVTAPRAQFAPIGGQVLVERDSAPEVTPKLVSRGHSVQPVATLGRVGAVYCDEGLREEPESCVLQADPRGHGLAASPDL